MTVDELRSRLSRSGEIRVTVKVIPKSSKTAFVERLPDGVLKFRVAAPPERGKANAALCEFLARQLGVPKANVVIESGHASPLKRLRITLRRS